MNKPLKDWTLGEIKQECKKHPGACCIKRDCPFMGDAGCALKRATGDVPPYMWDLSGPPGWTEQDKEDARAIKAILLKTSSVTIARLPGGTVKLSESDRCVFLDLNRSLFPSLKPGESAKLDEIIGGAE